MKFYDFGIVLIIGIVCVCIIGGIGSVYLFGPDNPVEIVAEKVIEEETGIDVNLTPKYKRNRPTWKESLFACDCPPCSDLC